MSCIPGCVCYNVKVYSTEQRSYYIPYSLLRNVVYAFTLRSRSASRFLLLRSCACIILDMSSVNGEAESEELGSAPSTTELMRARLRPRGRAGQHLVPVVKKIRIRRGRGVATSDKRQVIRAEEDKKEAEQVKDKVSAKEKTEGGERDNRDTHKQVHIPTLQRTDSSYLMTAATKDCTNDCSDRDQESGRSLETEYPKPSSNYEKTQRRLARQKQLDDMRTREAALARAERLKRRRGLLLATHPSKKSRECKVMWKEESSLVEVFRYSLSPCPSSRGSTLEPEELD